MPTVAETSQTDKESIYTQEDLALLDVQKIPNHIAIVMDGNRRWAKKKGVPPAMGHACGAEKLVGIVKGAIELGTKVLTVYGFSTENWSRSDEEVDTLISLIKEYLISQRSIMEKEGIRLHTIGDTSRFSKDLLDILQMTKVVTAAGRRFDLVLALNYGSRNEICRAVRDIIHDFMIGKIVKKEINEELLSQYLDTAQWGDPELFIRTSGEMRVSNFLLWQIAYTEISILDVTWPDFTPSYLLKAVLDFQRRDRRWGS